MKLIFILAVVFLTGCASNSYFLLKNHHFESPEAKGGDFRFSMDFVPYQDVSTVMTEFDASGPTETVVVRNAKEIPDVIKWGDHSSLLLSLAPLERLDLSLDMALGDQPNYLIAKYQFLGDTRKNSMAGNFSLAGSLGFGLISVEEERPHSLYLDNFEVSGLAIRAAVIMGMRSTDILLFYWSNAYASFDTTTKYKYGLVKGDFKTQGNQWASMLGAELSFARGASLGIEYGYIHVDTKGADSKGFGSFAAKLGFNF